MLQTGALDLLERGALLENRFPEEAKAIAEVRAAAVAEGSTIVVAFGGHFKAGKSSLVNALLGRAMMPIWDRPKTGVPCWIRPGTMDRALIERDGGLETIPCTLKAIDQATSVLGWDGRPRSELQAIHRLQIELAGLPLHGNLTWVDCPGLNDTREMDERLAEAAERADLLVWVVSSQQPLAQSEQKFLARHLSRRGLGSVVFVLNLFLIGDLETEWRRLGKEVVPFISEKIRAFLRPFGGAHASQPAVLVASSRGMLETRGDCGKKDLLDLLADAGRLAPLAYRNRKSRLALAFQAASSTVGRRAVEVLAEFEGRKVAHARLCTDLLQPWHDALQNADKQMGRFLLGFSEEARKRGSSLASSLQNGKIETNTDYGVLLWQELRSALDFYRTQLGQGLEASLPTRLHQRLPGLLQTHLALPTFEIADIGGSVNASKGALLGMAFGALLTVAGFLQAFDDSCGGCAIALLGMALLIPSMIAGGLVGALLSRGARANRGWHISEQIHLQIEKLLGSFESRRQELLQLIVGPPPLLPLEPRLASEEEALLQFAEFLNEGQKTIQDL